MPILAYRYHRFSTKNQDKGSSIERQAEATEQMCLAHGWEMGEPPMEDRGRSAWKGDHLRAGELGRFKQRVDAGEIEPGSILVIENLDRLSRENVKKARRWIEEVTESGIKVAVASLNKVFDDASLSGENIVDLLQYLFEAQRSNAESQRKSEFRKKVNTDHIEMARRGEIYTPRAPLWLIERDGAWHPCPERAPIVRQIYQWSASGLGRFAISKRLNQTVPAWTVGWKTKRAEWKASYIKDILNNPAVEGEYHRKMVNEDRDEVILGYYPRIVEPELVEEARAATKARRGKPGAKSAEAINLFAGTVICSECSGAMQFTPNYNRHGTRYEYLVCRAAARNGSCGHRTQYRYDHFERGALREMLHLALDSRHFVKADEAAPLVARVAELKKLVEQTQTKVNNLLDQIENGEKSPSVATRLESRESELVSLQADLADAEAALDRARGTVSPDEHMRRVLEVSHAIHSDDLETRQHARRLVRAAIQSVVESVTFYRVWINNLKFERRIKMRLVGGHVMLWFDNEGNVLKERTNLDLYEADPKNAFSRILAGGEEERKEANASLSAQIRRNRNRVV